MKTLSILGIVLSIASIILLIPILNHWPEGPATVLIPISVFFLGFSIVATVKSFQRNN